MTNVIEILVSEIMNTNKSETCFVAIPFEEEFWNVYKKVYEPVIIECGMIPKITYNLYGEAYLLERIFEEINNAELMIADLTKNNPNVTFEVGIAQCLLTPVLITTQTPDELPFDLHHYIAIKYSDNDNGLENLKSKLKEIIINKKQVEPDFIFSKDKRIIIEPNDLKSYNTSVIFGRILLDRAGLIDVCSLLAQRARHSYWGMGRQIAWIKDTRFRKAILEAIKHDVDVKMLICAEGNSEWYKNEWESLGVEVKYLDHGYLRLVIADKKAVVYGIPFEVKKVKTYRGYCGELIQGKNSEKIINSWVDYFSDLWQIGTNKPEELLNNIEKVINDTNIIKRLPKKIDTIKWIFFDLDKTLYINQKLLCEYEKLVIDLISSKKGLSNEAAEDIFSKCNNELWDQDNEIHPPLLQIALKSGLTPKELGGFSSWSKRTDKEEHLKRLSGMPCRRDRGLKR